MGISVRSKGNKPYIFVRHGGERIAFKCVSEEEANDIAKALRHELACGRLDIAELKKQRQPKEEEPAAAPTLKEYFETRFTPEYLEGGVRESTLEAYQGAFNLHILPKLGALPIDQITRSTIKAFVGFLTKKTYTRRVIETTVDDAGKTVRTPTTIERRFSKASIRIITASLGACLNHAREDGLIQENPANRLTKWYKQSKPFHPEIQPLTADEVPLFLQAARQYTPDYYTMFLTLLHTGVRSGECAGLQWGDLDFAGKFVIVRRTVTPSGRIEKTKTDRVRRIDMSDELAIALKAHHRESLEKAMKDGTPIADWVFANGNGKPASMLNVKNRAFARALQKAGLRRIRLHDLRHSYASILISAGVSVAYVQTQLGHSSVRMTIDTYTHLIPGAGRQALRALPGMHSAMPAADAAAGD